MKKNLILLLLAGVITLFSCQMFEKVQHVLVIGIDGMGAYGLEMIQNTQHG